MCTDSAIHGHVSARKEWECVCLRNYPCYGSEKGVIFRMDNFCTHDMSSNMKEDSKSTSYMFRIKEILRIDSQYRRKKGRRFRKHVTYVLPKKDSFMNQAIYGRGN